MYGNVDAALLWLRLIAKYLVNECNMVRSKACYCIFCRKDEDGKFELGMSVHVNNVFMAGNSETLEKIKELIKLNFNMQ